jgi:hypothetical protein
MKIPYFSIYSLLISPAHQRRVANILSLTHGERTTFTLLTAGEPSLLPFTMMAELSYLGKMRTAIAILLTSLVFAQAQSISNLPPCSVCHLETSAVLCYYCIIFADQFTRESSLVCSMPFKQPHAARQTIPASAEPCPLSRTAR